MALSVGQSAPDFTLESTSGEKLTLGIHLKDKACILYFYPKDFTPGCNAQACEFRDHFAEFKGLDIPVFGISTDSISVHHRFKQKHQLPFDLLSDDKGEVSKRYDVHIPFVNIAQRVTYLLDHNHVIKAVYKNMFGARSHIQAMMAESKR